MTEWVKIKPIGHNSNFIPIRYFIHWRPQGRREVEGFAFQVPGWPEFHACVRRGSRISVDSDCMFDEWIVDHFETGYAISLPPMVSMEDAPAALLKRLEEVGREQVHRALRAQGVPVIDRRTDK